MSPGIPIIMGSNYFSSLSSVIFSCYIYEHFFYSVLDTFSDIIFFLFSFREYPRGTHLYLSALTISQKMDPRIVPHSPLLIYYPTIQISKSLIHFSFLTYRLVQLGQSYAFKSNPLTKRTLNYIPNLAACHRTIHGIIMRPARIIAGTQCFCLQMKPLVLQLGVFWRCICYMQEKGHGVLHWDILLLRWSNLSLWCLFRWWDAIKVAMVMAHASTQWTRVG